ncbi:hypothetical protein RUND412_005948 [Rhizina undulata]
MFRGYNNAYPVLVVPRRLPAGDCSFVLVSDRAMFDHTAAPTSCGCRTFWSNPHNGELCACGHHACFHSPDPTPSPAANAAAAINCSTGSTTYAAYVSLSQRLAKLESQLASGRLPGHECVQAEAYQGSFRGEILGVLDDKIEQLLERMEEAEERLLGAEQNDQELIGRIEDVDRTMLELQEELEAVQEDDRYYESGDDLKREQAEILKRGQAENLKREQAENLRSQQAEKERKKECHESREEPEHARKRTTVRTKAEEETPEFILVKKRRSSCPEAIEEPLGPKRIRLELQ